MTLPASDSWEIAGTHGPKYRVGPYCSNPTCSRIAEHAHHIVRRSRIAGDYAWVTIDGKLLANLTGLCAPCHDDVTGAIGGHKKAIRYEPEEGFLWCTVVTGGNEIEYAVEGPLDPQPPTPESLAARTPEHPESDDCPFCGQRRRRSPKPPSEGRRRRKSWTIKVPADSEDGATVLDTLIEDLALVLGVEIEGEYRYYVVVPALVFAQQNQRELVESMKGRGA